ncbi:hypothetical protein GLOIN_2v1772697 [Rhizophagus irregularis DAOM 181602=DAOM 197198]|uniref:Uncharacterized protein n=1 Tax=Rhizophagus irregularis (strain DAOM 181602 / DAOM 197198 / MUCL 43194) TaxID=747089 RepID=A0A2P4Q6J2_RHIID|nr:hypothetical protein GLOIN_2v1772697 [Rhizophagus irregularis DAOM 181602=DAOM 197198]POG73269.1 hypothetical protein GLOIN_2v1772697 [Rhizophagus irregularis DAOM 181602=DAOM 197198]|eukprot:XP_025180135.1 hypothetical protein GLOIN_2v1772697 [Rhizophagus irregularis DAOM 181602=DAOM 197198]
MTSATGIYQTATDFEPAIYKRLEGLQTTYADEFYELGSSFDNFWSTSPSLEDKWNIQSISAKGSTNTKSQQQKIKKSKLTLKKMISTVMTGYTPEDKANASLNKAFNTDFNFEEFKEVELRQESKYFAKGLRWTEIEGKSLGNKKQSTLKNKGFDGNDKLTILAEIRVLLKSLTN